MPLVLKESVEVLTLNLGDLGPTETHLKVMHASLRDVLVPHILTHYVEVVLIPSTN